MENAVLSHYSALLEYRKTRRDSTYIWEPTNFTFNKASGSSENLKAIFKRDDLANRYDENLQQIELLVPSSKKKHKSSSCRHHILESTLPRNSFMQVDSCLYCVAPELLAIQIANSYDFYEAYFLITELCGLYTIDNNTFQGFSNYDNSLTSKSKIDHYLDKCISLDLKINGTQNLKHILKYINDNSASPMETFVSMMLCAPRNMGCYGATGFLCNKQVTLSDEAKQIADQDSVYPDLVNLFSKTAVEYDSTLFHNNNAQDQKDKRRRDALIHDGWNVFTIVPKQFFDPGTFKIIARDILKSAGQNNRIRNKHFDVKNLEAYSAVKRLIN